MFVHVGNVADPGSEVKGVVVSTGIEWTDETWNPVVGCSKVSPGCDNCYAIDQAARIQRMGTTQVYEGTTLEDGSDWSGLVRCLPERLDQPGRWRRPRRIFVNSMSDLFHPDVPDVFIAKVFQEMGHASWHQFQVLTKRPQRMAAWMSRVAECELGWLTHDGTNPARAYDGTGEVLPRPWPPPNVWLGTSIESDRYTFRANHLRETPAAVRFLSLEPLLGPLPSLDLEGIDWVIVGGESGPRARPMHPDWVRDLRDRCQAAGVAFFFKQWGEWLPKNFVDRQATVGHVNPDGSWHDIKNPGPIEVGGYLVHRVGKHKAGRELDGRTWDEYPKEKVPA